MFVKFRLRRNAINRAFYCTCNDSKKLYSNTIFLPKTKFPLRLENKNLLERDEKIATVAEFDTLYKWQRSHLSEPEFVLHDGPPYANGQLHMGHALNKILKDIILRYQMLEGHKVHFVPGWDCHGLPIELKALSKPDASPLEIRTKARTFAKKTIYEQKENFKSWGIIGDWNKHYATYNPDYVKQQIKIFDKLYLKNLIYRDVKPIYWSPSSRTALAEAELEYNEKHISKSAFVRFKVENFPKQLNHSLYALIWTTTPWTLPANQSVCYNPTMSYVIAKNTSDNCYYIVASDALENLSKSLNTTFEAVEKLSTENLGFSTYVHPVYKDKILSFLPSSHATASKGTGLVHTAPAHGPEDFLVALSNKMEIENLVGESGCYDDSAGAELKGKFVLGEGSEAVLGMIKGDVVHLHDYVHSYPYDWRSKTPVIVRASKQWFLDTESIKSRAIELLEDVKIFPKVNSDIYKRNLVNQIEKRPYWCISRQRKWGVPIPVNYDKQTDEVIISEDLIRHYYCLIDKFGTDFWWELPLDKIIPEELRNQMDINNVAKGQDILDIWFDSGISWANVLEGDKVADLYLEGVDQFTGWFQSSLLTSVALRDKAPYKSIYVHGFVVDENGTKMSKSVGNVINPDDIIKGNKKMKPGGIDTLRWWVGCHANQDALAHISNTVLQACSDELQKIRGTLRFALGCLSDYEPIEVTYDHLSLLDKYMLHLLYLFHEQGTEASRNYQFNQICKSVINLLTNPVSALYYNAIKDRLYCDNLDSMSRRSSQFVLLQIFEVVTQAIGPIVPHLVEEMYQNLPQKTGKTYFTSTHRNVHSSWRNSSVEGVMNVILNMKKDINKEAGPAILDSSVTVRISKSFAGLLKETTNFVDLGNEMEDIFQVSEVSVSVCDLKVDYELEIKKSLLFSCARCRRVKSESVNEICSRCCVVLKGLQQEKVVLSS